MLTIQRYYNPTLCMPGDPVCVCVCVCATGAPEGAATATGACSTRFHESDIPLHIGDGEIGRAASSSHER